MKIAATGQVIMLSAFAALFLLCSCAQQAIAEPSYSAVPTEAPVTTPTATEALITRNPISLFYDEYNDFCFVRESLLSRALTSHNSIDSLEALMDLSDHGVLMTKALVSVGRLTPDDEDYSGSIYGAASGYGALRVYGENDYRFSFSYSDGRSLKGVFDGERLEYSLFEAALTPDETPVAHDPGAEYTPGEPDSSEAPTPTPEPPPLICRAELSAVEGGWLSVVKRGDAGDSISVLYIGADASAFCAGVDAALLPSPSAAMNEPSSPAPARSIGVFSKGFDAFMENIPSTGAIYMLKGEELTIVKR